MPPHFWQGPPSACQSRLSLSKKHQAKVQAEGKPHHRQAKAKLLVACLATYTCTFMRSLTHLERLEARCNHIFREVVAEAVNAVMLYSVEKDRSVMLPVARKAFYPGPPPFPMFHVASGSDFADLLATGSEWQGRTINKGLSSSLEDKNQEGYF